MDTKLKRSRSMTIYKNVRSPKNCSRCRTDIELMVCCDNPKGYYIAWCCSCTTWKQYGKNFFTSLADAQDSVSFTHNNRHEKLLVPTSWIPAMPTLQTG
jgi:hypothetical protein